MLLGSVPYYSTVTCSIGMQRSGDAVLSVSGTRFGLAMPISLRNVTVRALHRRSSPVGGLQAAGVAHLDVLTTRFRVSLGTTGMNLDDFKVSRPAAVLLVPISHLYRT